MPYELTKSFTSPVDPDGNAANVIAANRFVKRVGGIVQHCDANDDPAGISGEAAPASTANDPAKTNINTYALTDGSLIEVEADASAIVDGSPISTGATGLATLATTGAPILGHAEVANGGNAGTVISIRVARGARLTA